jgi:hypothetical protein
MSNPLSALLSTPLARLTPMMKWANRGNAALLIVTGLLGFFGAFSAGVDMLSSALLSIYVSGFGALLLRHEFAVGVEVNRDFGFMNTFVGRAAYLLLVANLAWTCHPLGVATAILTNLNAVFSFFLMAAHPSFTSGAASPTAIGNGDETMEMTDVTRNSSSFDPSSAARMRDSDTL